MIILNFKYKVTHHRRGTFSPITFKFPTSVDFPGVTGGWPTGMWIVTNRKHFLVYESLLHREHIRESVVVSSHCCCCDLLRQSDDLLSPHWHTHTHTSVFVNGSRHKERPHVLLLCFPFPFTDSYFQALGIGPASRMSDMGS